VDANPAGTTFCLAAGTYRLSAGVQPKNNQTFIGAGRGQTILTGAKLLTSWTKDGAAQRWYASIALDGSVIDEKTFVVQGGETFIGSDSGGSEAKSRGDTFYNGARLKRVHAVSSVGGNDNFYPDYANGRVYVGRDPAQATSGGVEVANVPYAFIGQGPNVADGVTVKNLTITKFGNRAGTPGEPAVYSGFNWTVDNVEVSLNHAKGVYNEDGMVLTNSFMLNNGVHGSGGGGTGILVENNEIAHNNEQLRFPNGWATGGIKFGNFRDGIVRNNLVHDNNGNGIWSDCNGRFGIIEDNTVYNNTQGGIMWEVSYEAIIRNNTSYGNGFSKFNDGPGYGTNIFISSSGSSASTFALDTWWTSRGGTRAIQVYGNTVDTYVASGGDSNAISLTQQDRNSGCGVNTPFGEHLVQDVSVHDNTVTMRGQGEIGAYQGGTVGAVYASNNHFEANTYHVECSAGNTRWHWQNADHTFAEWQGYGNDTPTGSSDCSLPPAP
jgi:parallel beta-helix repeat protein